MHIFLTAHCTLHTATVETPFRSAVWCLQLRVSRQTLKCGFQHCSHGVILVTAILSVADFNSFFIPCPASYWIRGSPGCLLGMDQSRDSVQCVAYSWQCAVCMKLAGLATLKSKFSCKLLFPISFKYLKQSVPQNCQWLYYR